MAAAGDVFYTNIIARTKKIIQKYGRQFTITMLTDNAPVDMTKPWDKATPTPTVTTLSGVFSKYERKLIDNTTIKESDLKLIFVSDATLSWTPTTRDTIAEVAPKSGGYIIVDVDIIAPGDVEVAYTLQLRKG